MLKKISSHNVKELKAYLTAREDGMDSDILLQVNAIIEEVKKNGDQALLAYTKQFDHVTLESLIMEKEEMEAIYQRVDPTFIADLMQAKENITLYHKEQIQRGYEIQGEKGIYMGQRVLPLQRVGVYVPAGRAVYPSTVLMNVIPAKLAGVKEIVMVTPPMIDGSVNPYIVAAAKITGVDKIYKVGGAQAIAALAYGTKTIPKVDKIVGPGNQYVACAKKLVYGKVDIDMIAGPSEILIIGDEKANPKYVAADLISQAEHDPMASSILITTTQSLIDEVNKELKIQMVALAKATIIESSLQRFGSAILCDTVEEAITIANQIAPEHLELMVMDAKSYLPLVINAGSVFLGYYTCESIGDYFGGPNHVLPTNGTARFASALSCDSFCKKSSYLHYSKEALLEVGHEIINLANHEQLEGHANAVKVRIHDESN